MVVSRGEQGLARLRYENPDVCVLDLMLPERDGWSVIETARAEGIGTPIVVVSARGTEHDRVHALEIGADDYLVKPFSMKELSPRVRVAARRGVAPQETPRGEVIEVEELRIDPREVQAYVAGESADLTPTEFRLLYALALEDGRVVSRDELLQRLWGRRETHRDRTVDVFVKKLREKLDRRARGTRSSRRATGSATSSSRSARTRGYAVGGAVSVRCRAGERRIGGRYAVRAVRSYTVTPPTVRELKCAATHVCDLRAAPSPEAAAAAGEEVVDLPGGDQLLELRERRRRVAPVEAADRQDRLAARDLHAGRAVGADRRRGPAVAARVLEQRDQLLRGRGGVEQPSQAAAPARPSESSARTEPAAALPEPAALSERAARRCEPAVARGCDAGRRSSAEASVAEGPAEGPRPAAEAAEAAARSGARNGAGMRSRGGLGRVGERGCEQRREGDGRDRESEPGPRGDQGQCQDRQRRSRCRDEHCIAQPGLPVRRPAEELERPDPAQGDGDGQQQPADDASAVAARAARRRSRRARRSPARGRRCSRGG